MAAKYTVPIILITLITMSMVITGTTIFMADVVGEYGVSSSQIDEYSSFSKLQEMQQKTRDISGTLQNTTVEQGSIESDRGFLSGALDSMMLTIDSVQLIGTMASEAVGEMPVDTHSDAGTGWFLPGVIAILTIIVLTAVIALITKTQPGI